MKNLEFKDKFLKYKMKYLKLKGGGQNVCLERKKAADDLINQLNRRADFKKWIKEHKIGVFQLKIKIVRAIKLGLINLPVQMGCDGDMDTYNHIIKSLEQVKDLWDNEIYEDQPLHMRIIEQIANEDDG